MKFYLNNRLRILATGLFMLIASMGILYSSSASAAGTTECISASVSVDFNITTGDTAASATGVADNPICEMFIAVKQVLLGKGYVLATLAIIILGVAAVFGRISYPQALTVAAAIALVFGADTFIEAMNPDIALTLNGGAFTFSNGTFSYADPVSSILGVLIGAINGPAGRAVAVVCIIIIGLGGLYGKVSWIQVFVLVAGIGLVFGALNIVVVFQNAIYGGTLGFISNLTTNYEMFSDILTDPVASPFLNLIDFMTGDIGVSLATVSVMALGFAAMLGKLSWVQAMVLATGIALVFGAADVIVILSSPFALCTNAETDAFTQVICGFMVELQGPMGKTLATLAIIIIGILSMLGKVSWELGFVVTIGIALIFGADTVVSLFETSMNGVTCNGTTVPSAPSTGNAIADVLCYIIMILYGPAGKALATVAVIMMGFGALVGKVSYSQAFVVAIGIAVTFGAPQLVNIILPSASTGGCHATAGGGSGDLLGSLLSGVNGC